MKKLIIILSILTMTLGSGMVYYLTKNQSQDFSEAQQIPESIISATEKNAHMGKILYTKNKVIYYTKLDSCPGSRLLHENVTQALKELPILTKIKYKHMPETVAEETHIYCKDIQKCWQLYLYKSCSGGFCIINPSKKQIIRIRQNQTEQIEKTLKKYKNW